MTRAPLSQLDDWKLVDSDQDIRGWPLKGADGRTFGEIREMIVDTDTRSVEALVLDDGTLVPMGEVRLDNNAVYLRQTEPLAAAPLDADTTPGAGAALDTDSALDNDPLLETSYAGHDDPDAIRIPVVAEELRVGKRETEGGGVRVEVNVEEVPVEEQVSLRHEELSIHREQVDRPLAGDELETLKDGTIEIRTHDQQAVVEKQARVVEEVIVDKDITERTETIEDTLRRTEVDIQQLDDRKHDRTFDSATRAKE